MGVRVLLQRGGNQPKHHQCLKLKNQKVVREACYLEIEDTHIKGLDVVVFGVNKKKD